MLERVMIILSIEINAIGVQVEAEENRATSRCPKYNKNNVLWKKVDNLLKEQERIILKIKEFNNKTIQSAHTPVVSEFLNLSSPDNSPDQKRKAISTTEVLNAFGLATEKITTTDSPVVSTINVEMEDAIAISKKSKVSD